MEIVGSLVLLVMRLRLRMRCDEMRWDEMSEEAGAINTLTTYYYYKLHFSACIFFSSHMGDGFDE